MRYKFLKIVLLLLGLSSAGFGLGLWLFPDLLLGALGLSHIMGPPFFPRQSGVFELILGIGYLIAAYNPKRFGGLVLLAIFSKTFLGIFLITQFLVKGLPFVVLRIGVFDLVMVVLIIAFGGFAIVRRERA